MKNNVPPLKIWSIVLLLFVFTQGFIYFNVKQYSRNRKNREINKQLKTLQDNFKESDSSTYKVVVIGSSLVYEGIECPDRIRRYAQEKHQQSVQLNKIFLPGEPLKFLVEKKKIFQELMATKPDLICIQRELIGVDIVEERKKKRRKRRKRKRYKKIKKQAFRFYNELAIANKQFGNRVLKNIYWGVHQPEICNRKDPVIERDTNNHTLNNRKVQPFDSLHYTHSDFQQLQQLGIKTIILNVPLPSSIESSIYSGTFKTELDALLWQYEKSFDMEYWGYDGKPMYFTDYFDYGHLNKKGRKIYSQWFVDKIVEKN